MGASDVIRVERRQATEAELEVALRRILSVPGSYDGDEITRILKAPGYGFETGPPDGQFTCLALVTKIFREDQNLQLGLIRDVAGRVKLAILNHQAPS